MTDTLNLEPSLTLLSRPTFDADAVSRWLRAAGLDWTRSPGATAAEELVELAGRICYMSFGSLQSPRSNDEYIRNLITLGHESVLEHAAWTFLLEGVSRSFSHQLVRHRVGFAFSQLSQQYADQTEMIARLPITLRNSERLREMWLKAVDSSRAVYREIVTELGNSNDIAGQAGSERERRRAIRSTARSVLPEATETKFVFSANARAIRHFLRVRGGIVGDEEMRLVAAAILRVMETEGPTLVFDFEMIEVGGLPLVRTVAER